MKRKYVRHSEKTQNVWLGHVLGHESAVMMHDIIEGRMRGKGSTRKEENAPAEQSDERKVCGTQKEWLKTGKSG